MLSLLKTRACFIFLGFSLVFPVLGQNSSSQQALLLKRFQFKNHTVIHYFVSKADSLKYCNGGVMNSSGYKKTIMNQKTAIVSQKLTKEAQINVAIRMASGDNNITRTYKQIVKLRNHVVYIRPISGWASISIFMCAWKPLVEANIEQFPTVKRIKWMEGPPGPSELKKWQNL